MSFLKRLFNLGIDRDYKNGMRYYNCHMYREAIEQFENILATKSPSISLNHNLARFYCSQAYRNLGIVLFATGNTSSALQKFQKALELNPEHVDLYYFIGVCLNNIGRCKEAIDAFNHVIRCDPGYPPTRFGLAITFHNLKMWDRAISIYKDILKKNPGYADVNFHLGLAFLGQANIIEAMKVFQSAVSINPNYVDARIKLGITQTYLGKFDEALKNFSFLTEKFPEYPDIHYFLGIIFASRNEISEAVKCFNRSLQINPNYKDAKIKLAILYCREEKFDAALEELDGAGRLDTDDKNLKRTILTMHDIVAEPSYSMRKKSEALEQILGGDKPLTEAIKEFNKHLDITPTFSEMLSFIKIKEFSQEDASLWETFIPLVKDYLKQHPTYPDPYNTLGTLYLKLNRTKEAEKVFHEAIRLNPEYVQARINLCKTLKNLGKFQEALRHGEYLLSKKVSYPDVYYTMGEIYFSLSRYDESLHEAKKALELRPQYPHADFLAAQSYEKLGQVKEAIQEYKKCLESNSDDQLYAGAKEGLNRCENA
jgi:tetratricopeptide (TPR) repeat protein